MIKRISFVRRRAGMTVSEFRRYWLEVHSDLGRQLPGIRAYRINFVNSWEESAPEAHWDGFSEIWFDSEVEMDRALMSMWTELEADRDRMFDQVVSARVDEFVILDDMESDDGSAGDATE